MASKKKKNIILERVEIENYAAEGKSLARLEGKVVFVERTVPGDVVDVQLSKNKKDWAEGYPVTFHSYSPQRVTPFCTHFGNCGGCQWQTVPYTEQLKFKQQQVQDVLQRIGKVPLPEFLPIAGCKEDRYYRNKLEYTFGSKRYVPYTEFKALKAEAVVNTVEEADMPVKELGGVGFHAKGFFDKIVDIQQCHLQAEPTNKVRESIREFAEQNKLTYYDAKKHTGFLRNVQLRICNTAEVMVNIIVGEDDFTKTEPLLQHVIKQVPGITTLLYTVNTKWNDTIYDLTPIAFFGKGFAIEKLEQFEYKIGPKSFFQTNTKQAEKLYQITRNFAELTGTETVYDLYCGTGSIGIFVSKLAKKIIGVEVVEAAIEDAKENAALNNITTAEFFAGDVIKICDDDFFAKHGRPDVIITDPPRAGMHEKLVNKILQIEAPLVVYVSCNPATQARDLNLLGEKYEVTKVQPVDMFPHTHHIENVVQLKLKTVVK